MLTDTIAAISTPPGEGGIAVIRLSGSESIRAADGIFSGKQSLADASTHTIHYGFIRHPQSGERLEEALVSVMRAPRSFTAEDVVEISCHGGYISVRRVLNLLLEQGVSLAEPGEFTKRAFLNGRIDLSQAEAVIDLIRSKSDRAFAIAFKQAQGGLSDRIGALRRELLELMAHIEVNIDYPEHDVAEMTGRFIAQKCANVRVEIEDMLRTADQGKILREGIATAIIGRPNVGKSSLLNLLANENRAIVTDIPGTTRDVIEEYVTVGGIPLRLMDTAGIRETADAVERIGVEKSRTALSAADLILFVLDHHDELHEDERLLIDQIGSRPCIAVVNKSDLPRRLDMDKIREVFPADRIVEMSALNRQGTAELEKAVVALFFSGRLETNDLTYVSNARHIQLLKQADRALLDALDAVERSIPIDMIQIDVRGAWEALGEVIGDAVGDSLLDQIFSQFCLGK